MAQPQQPFPSLPVPPPTNPSTVFAMEQFPNETLFHQTVDYPALSVPVQDTAKVRTVFKHKLLMKHKNVYIDKEDKQRRIVVFRLDTTADDLASNGNDHWKLTQQSVTRSYKDMPSDEILRKLIPLPDIPSAFELVGTIAHINLRDEFLPYKHWIGKVLLDKNGAVQTVVHKSSTIATVYRTFSMEVLAGNRVEPDWSITTVLEHGHTFHLDFRKVYWNSRLASEHQRLIQSIGPNQVVADLMAGVGPFAVPLTSRKHSSRNITCYANDLNPASFEYLERNKAANKCQRLYLYNMDARDFAQQILTKLPVVHHVIMNLPAAAPEFLDAFVHWKEHAETEFHVYCFCPKADDHQSAVQRCAKALQRPIVHANIHMVRDVSPGKNMLCVSFTLNHDDKNSKKVEPATKKQKT